MALSQLNNMKKQDHLGPTDVLLLTAEIRSVRAVEFKYEILKPDGLGMHLYGSEYSGQKVTKG